MKTTSIIASLAYATSVYADQFDDLAQETSDVGVVSKSQECLLLKASCDGSEPLPGETGDLCWETYKQCKYAEENSLFDENSDIDQDSFNLSLLKPRNDGSPSPSLSQVLTGRKLKQLKVLILWLQPEHRFARYCFYGCYCLPDADHKIYTVGYGKPVDNIDGSCKRQSQCYDCAAKDHESRGCDASTQGYNYKLRFDPNDPTNHWKKSIECLDDHSKGSKNSCKRSVCECDKKLSEDLREHYHEWFVGHHQEQGTFDSSAACQKENCKNGNCGGHRETQCCGYLGSGVRMPFKTNGRRKCCGDKTFDSAFQECCDGNILAAVGTC